MVLIRQDHSSPGRILHLPHSAQCKDTALRRQSSYQGSIQLYIPTHTSFLRCQPPHLPDPDFRKLSWTLVGFQQGELGWIFS